MRSHCDAQRGGDITSLVFPGDRGASCGLTLGPDGAEQAANKTCVFFSIPSVAFALLFHSFSLVVTQIRGHITGSSAPLNCGTRLAFL